MLKLKVKKVEDFMCLVEVLKANGYEVKTYVQVGGDTLHFTVEVPDVTIEDYDKPSTRFPGALERINQHIKNLRRNKND